MAEVCRTPIFRPAAAGLSAIRPLARGSVGFSVWGIAYRYPGVEDSPEPLPEIEELERTITLLKDSATMAGRPIDEE